MKILKKSLYTLISALIAFSAHAQTLPGDTCQAAFTVILDSTSHLPYAYHFQDMSSGEIDSWMWEFGDGKSSTERNPVHNYESEGTYQVCLTISKGNPVICQDQACQEIVTLDYFSLGGQVYAGELPLNNPQNQGDTGIASLYRMVNQQLVYVEDSYFTDLGYYWFGFLIPGQYVIKIGLTEGSTHYGDYFTTYFGDDLLWSQADIHSIDASDDYAADINLVPVQDPGSGPGTIRGSVNFEQDNENALPPLSQTSIILFSSSLEPLLFTKPDAAGKFEFSGIPFGTYIMKADATGKPSSTATILLSDGSPLVEGINLTVFGSNVSGINELWPDQLALATIFPNPVKDILHLKINSPVSTEAVIQIFNVAGSNCLTATHDLETGMNQLSIPVKNLSPGVYFIRVASYRSPLKAAGKFVK